MAILVAVFILQSFVQLILGSRAQNHLIQWLALNAETIASGKLWTLITYGLLHDPNNPLHLLLNLLGLFLIGRGLEQVAGSKTLIQCFLLSVFSGGLLYLLFHLGGGTPVLGASGAVMGLIAYYCMRKPDDPMTLLIWFIIPVTLKPKWILAGLATLSLLGALFQELPGQSGTAHSAHLGGLIGGMIFHAFHAKTFRWKKNLKSNPFGVPITVTPPPAPKVKKVSYSVNLSSREKLKAEVNRILDKINEQGFGSLTAEEREILDQAKEILRK
jgi:membrane associated rhomboid family serine protease